MADWTTPTYVAPGADASSSKYNVEAVDNLLYLFSAVPKGRVGHAVSTLPVTLATAAQVYDTDATLEVVNNDDVERRYLARAKCRFNMMAGSNGLYRPLVTDGAGASLGETVVQVTTNVTGGAGQVGGIQEHGFTLPASSAVTLAAGALRVIGGSATDSIANGAVLDVYDLGRA